MPPETTQRLATIDIIRGLAVCGMFGVTAIIFGMGPEHILNLSADAPKAVVDWLLTFVTSVFATSKSLALFAMIFGASLVLFFEKAVASGHDKPVVLVLWRCVTLFVIGLLHLALWDGDILTIYALLAPVILLVSMWPDWLLVILATLSLVVAIACYVIASGFVDVQGYLLGPMWYPSEHSIDYESYITQRPYSSGQWFPLGTDPTIEALLGFGFIATVVEMMILGVVLYRNGFLTGRLDDRSYQLIAVLGIGVGIVPGFASIAILSLDNWLADHILIGSALNVVSIAPMACGYAAAIIWLSRRSSGGIIDLLRCAGRMALTNYIAQTMLGVFVLRGLHHEITVDRTFIALFVLVTWVFQLVLSKLWLQFFAHGPIEWLWRSVTYRQIQPFLRSRLQG